MLICYLHFLVWKLLLVIGILVFFLLIYRGSFCTKHINTSSVMDDFLVKHECDLRADGAPGSQWQSRPCPG